MKNTAILLVMLAITICLFTSCVVSQSPLEDIEWVLISFTIDGESRSVLPDTQVTVTFDAEEKQLSGNAGCNLYGGGYEINGSKIKTVEPFYMTEMYCGDERDKQEREYLEVLQSSGTFEVDGDILRIEGGKGVLNFERG